MITYIGHISHEAYLLDNQGSYLDAHVTCYTMKIMSFNYIGIHEAVMLIWEFFHLGSYKLLLIKSPYKPKFDSTEVEFIGLFTECANKVYTQHRQ